MNIHYGQAAISIFIVLVAVARYLAVRKRLRQGQSKTEALLDQAGGAENLLRNAKRIRLYAYALLLFPFVYCLALWPSPHFLFALVLGVILVIPAAAILFYFSWNAKRVVADGVRIRDGRHEPTV